MDVIEELKFWENSKINLAGMGGLGGGGGGGGGWLVGGSRWM